MICCEIIGRLLLCGLGRCVPEAVCIAFCLKLHRRTANIVRLFLHLQIIDNIGNWLNYVATLSLVEQLAGGQGLLISALIIVRFLPSFLMFPLAGVVADR